MIENKNKMVIDLLGARAVVPMISLASGCPFQPQEVSHYFLFLRYLNNQVFVSLANGELVVYQREAGTHRTHLPSALGGN